MSDPNTKARLVDYTKWLTKKCGFSPVDPTAQELVESYQLEINPPQEGTGHITDRSALEGLDGEICELCGEVNKIPDDGTELSKHKCGTLRAPRALLATLLDLIMGTQDWGSDFFDEEEAKHIRELAKLLDIDPITVTQATHRCAYRGQEKGVLEHDWRDWISSTSEDYTRWAWLNLAPGQRWRGCKDCSSAEFDPPRAQAAVGLVYGPNGELVPAPVYYGASTGSPGPTEPLNPAQLAALAEVGGVAQIVEAEWSAPQLLGSAGGAGGLSNADILAAINRGSSSDDEWDEADE